MGSASSRMSASPTLVQTIPERPRTSASLGTTLSKQRQSALGLKHERSDPVHPSAPARPPYPSQLSLASPSGITLPSLSMSKDTMAATVHSNRVLDPKGKGKQRAIEEKEEGEISEEDEVYRISEVDSWRPSVGRGSVPHHHSPLNASRQSRRHSVSRSHDRQGAKRTSQASTATSSSINGPRRSTSKSPTNQLLSLPSPSQHRHSIVSDANTTTSSTPSSDSLALPESESTWLTAPVRS